MCFECRHAAQFVPTGLSARPWALVRRRGAGTNCFQRSSEDPDFTGAEIGLESETFSPHQTRSSGQLIVGLSHLDG